MFQEKPKVLIAGAGPVGLFAALSLAKRGIRVHIVDTGLWPCSHSYALGLHPESLRLLKGLGLLEPILKHAFPIRAIGFYDGAERRAQIRFDQTDEATGCLAVLPQSLLEDLFEAALAENDVHVSWRHEVSSLTPGPDYVTATINKFERESRGYAVAHSEWAVAKTTNLEVPFVIGADGHNSRVRRALKVDFPEVGPAQYFAVFEFMTDADLGHETRIVLDERTTNVLWPLAGGYCRWSFQMPDYTDAHAEAIKDRLLESGFGNSPTKRAKDSVPPSEWGKLPLLDDQNLKHFIEERAPWFKGSITDIRWRTVVRFERRLATHFGEDRIWLAGDAAHLAGPAGVQSMNIGLLEAHDLADSLEKILNKAGSLHYLSGYDRHWTSTWKQLHGLGGCLKPTNTTDPWVAANAGRLLACLPGHGSGLAELAGQLGLEFEPGRVVGAAQ